MHAIITTVPGMQVSLAVTCQARWSSPLRWWMPVLGCVLLTACGGGGGSRSTPPPPPSPPPVLVQPPNPAYSQHLEWTGAAAAHAAGLSGAGVRIGVIDSGVNRNHPALRGRVTANLTYVNSATNNLAVDDVVGHGTAVAQVIAGSAFGQWPGGIAPGAEILSARIINDTPPADDGSGRGNEVSGALGLAPIHADLSQRGMRIMNNSWGGLYWTNPAATNPIAAEYRDFVHVRDGLVVFSAGNSGLANPSDTAALPSQPGPGGSRPAADLERGWLTVVALDGTNPNRLAEYSNACGLAMAYCLAAPGTVVVTGTDDPPNAPGYWRWSGTSFATPIVSGAAALVWEAFPYFNNDLVRQTLLGTATDIGDSGVDPVFGYGAINIERALNGPARLDWGDLQVAFDDVTSVWSNDLGGNGALIKDGSGHLILEGTVHTDRLDIRGGTLHTKNTVATDIMVGVQGRLVAGDGLKEQNMTGHLDNAGRVELASRTGPDLSTTWLDGDYRHRNTATLGLELGHRFHITGTAQIDGGTVHLLGVKPGYTHTTREELLLTSGGINGEFDTLSWAQTLFLQGALGYDLTTIWLDITRLDVVAAAQTFAHITPAGLSAAQRVERAFATIDSGRLPADAVGSDFLRVAGQFQQLSDEAMAVDVLERLSGQSHVQATSMIFDNIDQQRRTLSTRLAGMEGDRPGTWRTAQGMGPASAGFQREGWLMGHDARLGHGPVVVGWAFGQSRAEGGAGRMRDRTRLHQTQGQLYLARRSVHGYLAAQFGVGQVERVLERHRFAGHLGSSVFSRAAGHYGSLGLEAGGRLALGSAWLSPHVGVTLDWLDHAGFEEAGAAGLGLRTKAARMRRTEAVLGVRGAAMWRGLNVYGQAQWHEVLTADGFQVSASFTGIDSWSPLPQPSATRSGGVFGVGLEARILRHARLAAAFDQHVGRRGRDRMAWLRYVYGF